MTRVLGHLLDMFRLTLQTYTYESAIQRFTQGGDAIFFDACPGPPASYVHIDSPYVNSRIDNSDIHAKWRRNFFSRVLGHLLDMFRLRVHTYTYGVTIQKFTVATQFFLTRVEDHLLHTCKLTMHTHTHGSTIQRFTQAGDAFF